MALHYSLLAASLPSIFAAAPSSCGCGLGCSSSFPSTDASALGSSFGGGSGCLSCPQGKEWVKQDLTSRVLMPESVHKYRLRFFIISLLAHLSRRLMGDLIVYQSLWPPSVRQHFQTSFLKQLGQLKFLMETP